MWHLYIVLNLRFAQSVQKRLTKVKECGIIKVYFAERRKCIMLLEFTCANHKSIRDEVLFSTLAGKET